MPGRNEDIFPEEITNEMRVTDYKMVYYNPWGAQYLSYLVVEYEEDDFQTEVKRLNNYASTDYVGYYGSESFMSGYKLLAMEADPYYGFVYALGTDKNSIIYVELIFCNYFMDIDYESMKRTLPMNQLCALAALSVHAPCSSSACVHNHTCTGLFMIICVQENMEVQV